jgi:hypothetical protein
LSKAGQRNENPCARRELSWVAASAAMTKWGVRAAAQYKEQP